jgi:hypothetical protein
MDELDPLEDRRGRRPLVSTVLALARVDFAPRHRQPSPASLVVASLVALGGSLGADRLLVALGTHLFPSTRGYSHFAFSDYGTLTTIGVVIASTAWPVVTRISSAPRWLFVRLALVVTAVLLLPDLYIASQGQPGKAVGVLMLMHLAIGVVTYNALVHIAPPRQPEPAPLCPAGPPGG